MSLVTTELSRADKKERQKRHTLTRFQNFLALALLFLCVALAGAYASGSRVNNNTVIMGQNLSGLKSAEAIAALQQSFSKQAGVAFEIPGKRVIRTLAEAGLRPDFASMVKQASSRFWWAGVPQKWEYKGDVDQAKLALLVKELESGLQKPRDARFVVEGNSIRIEPSQNGITIDQTAMKDRILSALKSPVGSISVPVKEQKPALTTEQAKAMNLNRLLASYTTKYVEDKVRSENVKLAAARMSGHIVAPGELISFNKTVGPRNEEDGYKEASVFIGNKIEKGYGGGVCQVSTTLYNAVILANLEVTERHNHSMVVDYVPLGRDAAVVYEALDLVIKNNTPGHIMIVSETKPGLVTFKVFGDGPQVKVDVQNAVLSKTDFKVETIPDPTMPAGKTQVTPGKTGYRVVTHRIVTDAQQKSVKTLLAYSTYKPMNQVVKEGAKPEPPKPEPPKTVGPIKEGTTP